MRLIDGGGRRSPNFMRLALIAVVVFCALAGMGWLERGFLRRVRHDPRGMLIEAPRNYLRARASAPELPRLQVHMKFKHYESILARREEALRVGLLQTRAGDEVPAEIETDDGRLRVRMRLKGDWPDHFRTDKWSYRVKVRGSDAFHGMRRFSIQHPEARGYLGEWAYLRHLRREGILTPRYEFVRLVFNGSDKGIMAMEEHFAKELLESQGRREGPILKLDEEPYWEQRRMAHIDYTLNWFALDEQNFRAARVSTFSSAQMEADPVLAQQTDAGRALLEGWQRGELRGSEIFHVERMARFLAICRLWGTNHALIWHNLRWYYDPVSTRLEPIGFDGEPAEWTQEEMWRTDLMGGYELSLGFDVAYAWIKELMAEPPFRAAYMRELHRVSAPAYVDSLVEALQPEAHDNLMALRTEWPRLDGPFDALRRGGRFISAKLRQSIGPTVRLLPETLTPDSCSVELTNVSDVPLELVAFEQAEERLPLDEPIVLLPRRKLDPVRWTRLRIARPDGDPATWRFAVRTVGGREERHGVVERAPAPLVHGTVLPPAPTRTEFLARHPWIQWDDERSELESRPGEWELNEDLILPMGIGLRLVAGTTLRMASEALILSRAPVHIDGSEDRPVQLLPLQESWPGLVVLGAQEVSRWKHAHIRGTRSIERTGWILPGGVTFQDSPVHLENCSFADHRGEDALNIMQTSFHLQDCEFRGSFADAFDGDFVSGKIVDCAFVDIGGDGIDVSGSQIELRGVFARGVADKALSIGEGSHVRAFDIDVSRGSIAVAVKDLSVLTLRGGTLRDLKLGLAAYTKKASFGPATIVAEELLLEDVEQPVLVQRGSSVRLDKQEFEGSEVDVRELYRLGILGN